MAARDVPPAASESWDSKCALELVSTVTPRVKIPASRYLQRGRFPVIDQGQGAVAGFVEDADLLHTAPLPVIVFGDHTRVWKFATAPFAVGADGTKLLAPTEAIDPRFCFYALSHAPMKNLGYSRHFKLLREMSIPLPRSKDVQRKIAAILSSVDETIEKTEAVIAQLDVVKKAMLEELLTRGIPGRHSRFKQTEIGEVPEEWHTRTLEDLSATGTDICYGVVQPGPEFPGGVLLIRGGDFPDGQLNRASLRTISPSVSQQFQRTLLRGGEVVVALVGKPGSCAVVPAELAGANVARQAAVIRPSPLIRPQFLRLFLMSPPGQRGMLGHQVGSVQQVINIRDMKKVLVVVPSLQEQDAISAPLLNCEDRLGIERRNLDCLRVTKVALAEALLSGSVRVTT